MEIPAGLKASWKYYEDRFFSDCWACLFYLPGENVGSLSHTPHLDSLPGNPREEMLNHSFLHAVVDSWLLETCSVSAALLAEANRNSTKDSMDFPLGANRDVTKISYDGEFLS